MHLIKKYRNRKLYSVPTASYVTLADIGDMVKAGEELMVVDQVSQLDITATTLTQIVFQQTLQGKPVAIDSLYRIIRKNGDGGLGSYFA